MARSAESPSSSADRSRPDRICELEERVESLESVVSWADDDYADKFHFLQSLIFANRKVLDALLDATFEHSTEQRIELANQLRDTVQAASAELEQVTNELDGVQGRLVSSTKIGKAERILEFADGKRGTANLVAIPSDEIYGLLNDTSDRRCRQLMDELASALSFCVTDQVTRSDGKSQKRLKVDFSRKDLDEMVDQCRRSL